jgi:hypothetical protein
LPDPVTVEEPDLYGLAELAPSADQPMDPQPMAEPATVVTQGPTAETDAPDGEVKPHGAFARGRRLVARDGAVLPDRCIKCNAPAADGRATRRYSYNITDGPPSARFIPFIGRFVRLIWEIQQMLTRQRISVSLCLCKKHRLMRVLFMLATVIITPAGIGVALVGGRQQDTTQLVIGIIVAVIGILCIMGTKTLTVVDPSSFDVSFRGCGPRFLASLPSEQKRRRVR